jgi:N-acetylmuramoyl-L-alanine amidase
MRTAAPKAVRRGAACLSGTVLAVLAPVCAGCVGPEPAGSLSAQAPIAAGGRTTGEPADAGSRTAAPAGRAPKPVVVLDPGHNGANATHPDVINRPVAAGNGRTKACNTVGTQTADGYPEHAFTLDVARRARALLVRRGVTVLLTRPDDAGIGPCVDARASVGNRHRAAAVVAIHADGAPPAGHGFHVIAAATAPVGPATAAASHRLALSVRAHLLAESGLSYATYLAGGTGLHERSDIAGLNLSTRPAVLVECGNMRNRGDAARQSDPAGRQRIARALADGILAFLGLDDRND